MSNEISCPNRKWAPFKFSIYAPPPFSQYYWGGGTGFFQQKYTPLYFLVCTIKTHAHFYNNSGITFWYWPLHKGQIVCKIDMNGFTGCLRKSFFFWNMMELKQHSSWVLMLYYLNCTGFWQIYKNIIMWSYVCIFKGDTIIFLLFDLHVDHFMVVL